MSITHRLAVAAASACLSLAGSIALADEHPYAEGPVLDVARIRTVEGKFEDYMKFVSTTWKQGQELAKKAGYVISYEVLLVAPRGPDDPDILLVTRYKNWAALDGWIAKQDEVSRQTEGSAAAAEKSATDRNSIRRVLGDTVMQELKLK